METKRIKLDEESSKLDELKDRVINNPSVIHEDINTVLGDVRETVFPNDFTYVSKKVKNNRGFPEAKPRNKLIHPKDGNLSIFAQDNGLSHRMCTIKKGIQATSTNSDELSGSNNVSSEMLLKDVQKEHNDLLKNMTEDEIAKEQKELLETLDPKIINYFHKKANYKKIFSDDSLVNEGHKNDNKSPRSSDSMEDAEMMEDRTEKTDMSHEFPIHVEEVKKFVHMDNLEPDKLEWMTNIPPPQPVQALSGIIARFDFEGNILSKDCRIPVERGLHHHGDEPDRPGYTVEELLIFIRSSFSQQRVVGLQVLSNILRQCRDGLYDNVLTEPLIPCLLDAGLLFLLRYAVDDNTPHVTWALQALRNLLVSQSDEVCLDRVLSWPLALVQPSLPTEINLLPHKMKEFSEQKAELKDFQLVKLDVITALIRMDLLPRIRYILEMVRPPPVAVISALEILTRICRHSLESVWLVLNCDQLLPVINDHFMCPNWSISANPQQLTSVYSTPLRQAFKLIRVMVSCSKQVALRVLDLLPNMGQIIMSHMALDPSDVGVPVGKALTIILETHHLWRAFLSYGLLVQEFMYLFPVIMKSVQYYCTKLSINEYYTNDKYQYSAATALFGVIECVVDVCKIRSTSLDCKLEWANVSGLLPPLETCYIKWAIQLTRITSIHQINGCLLGLLGSCCSVLTHFYTVSAAQPGFDTVSRLESIESLFAQTFLPLVLQSPIMTILLSSLKNHSLVLDVRRSGTRRDSPNLPTLGSISWAGDVSPSLLEQSPFPFLVPWLELLFKMSQMHKKLEDQVYIRLFNHPALLDYMQAVSNRKDVDLNNYFLRYEVYFMYWLLKIADLKPNAINSNLYHRISLKIMRLCQVGDEWFMKDTLETLIFSPSIFKKPTNISHKMEQLNINSSEVVSAQGNREVKIIEDAWQRLASIRACYLTVVYPFSKSIEQSRRWVFSDVEFTESLTIKSRSGTCLPQDWMFIPLIQRFEKLDKQENKSEVSTPYEISTILSCLQFVYLLSHLSALDHISTTAKFCRVACVYLVANDIFLDKQINTLLDGLVREVLKDQRYEELNFEEDIPGIASFSDFYNSLVDQFAAVSYADQLFGSLVMIPMAPRFPVHLRRLLLTEQLACLRLLGTPVTEFPVPMRFMLEPPETNISMLEIYFKAILEGALRESWSPVLFNMTVSHIKQFLGSETDHPLKTSILKCLQSPKNQALQTCFNCK